MTQSEISPEGHKIIILAGDHAGQEGICLGRSASGDWAVSPNRLNIVIELKFPQDFGILINSDQEAGRN